MAYLQKWYCLELHNSGLTLQSCLQIKISLRAVLQKFSSSQGVFANLLSVTHVRQMSNICTVDTSAWIFRHRSTHPQCGRCLSWGDVKLTRWDFIGCAQMSDYSLPLLSMTHLLRPQWIMCGNVLVHSEHSVWSRRKLKCGLVNSRKL